MTDKERSEQVAKVMERVCDLCVHPVQATDQDELYDMVSGLVLCLRFNNSGIKFGMQYNDYCSYFEPKEEYER